jgi:cellulose synthase/poly-beta-1,6-N-acetylglucosamine synthase-like glycosyltransferase
MMGYFEEFFNYLASLTLDQFIRIFWFFFVFELVRFFLLDLGVLTIWKLQHVTRKKRYRLARNMLWAERPLVSIVVPGRNEGEHIFRLANSLKEQTYTNYEFIVVDDGSNDQTRVICNNLKKNGLITLFISNDVRGGKASAANLGLRYCKGKFIVHMDADCSYDRDAVENIIVPFYLDDKLGAVGGDVQVRNYDESLCTTLQAIEYIDTISIGRISQSQLGIYRIISGAFGAFRKEALDRVGGWDIGPGLDGDITVKVRKLGYNIHFEPTAVCQTNVPTTFKALTKQRLRWDKSVVRFRLRKHNDIFLPDKSFRWLNFISFVENITYNIVLNFKWYFYLIDIVWHFASRVLFILPVNYMLYTFYNFFKFVVFSIFRERKSVRDEYFVPFMPLMALYYGYYLRLVRTYAYLQEIFLKRSYEDDWNPAKTSVYAKHLKL